MHSNLQLVDMLPLINTLLLNPRKDTVELSRNENNKKVKLPNRAYQGRNREAQVDESKEEDLE